MRWQIFFLSYLFFWNRTVSLNICGYLYWLISAWSLQILLPSLRFLAWTSGQSCIPEVKELREPFLKHPISFIFLLRHWFAVSSKFLLLKNFWAVRDILLGSIFSKLRFFIVRIEPNFAIRLQRVYDLVFSKLAQIFVEKPLFGFFRGLGSISGSCFYSELGNANVCAEVEGTPINSMRDVVCLPKLFSASFGWKKEFVFSFVGTNSTLPAAHRASHIWRCFSKNTFLRSIGFLLCWSDKFVFDWSWKS